MLLLACLTHAATLAGATLPDSAVVSGHTLTLNGLGLREKYFLDIYVGELYLARRSSDAPAIIAADEPKRVVMQFVYPHLTRDQLVSSFRSDFGKRPGAAAHQADIARLIDVMPPELNAGDEMVFDYLPGTGTTLSFGGRPTVTIPGSAFMQVVWGMWLGDEPPTEALKRGLLGL